MKKLIYTLALNFIALTLQAQHEIKTNPIGAIFASSHIFYEFDIAKNISLEPNIGLDFPSQSSDIKSTLFTYGIDAKYYFVPKKGLDNIYSGIFWRGGVPPNYMTTGIELGYKLVSKHNILFEIGGGIGIKLYGKDIPLTINWLYPRNEIITNSESVGGFLRLNIGYRFSSAKNKEQKEKRHSK